MLIGCTKLERLRLSIHLRKEALTDVGLGFIGKYGINLRFLSLAYIGGSDEGLRALSMGCPRLRKLEMQGCILNEQAIASFLFNVHSLRYFWAPDDFREALTRPNFGSSTMEAQVPTQLKWYVKLADKLDRLALQLVAEGSGLKSVKVTYASTTVKIADVESRFVGAISESGDLKVEGTLKDGVPYLTKVGDFEVDVSLEGDIILCRQVDQPGIIGSVGTILGEEKVNVSFMSVGKTIKKEAVMAIVVDKKPTLKTLEKIGESWGVNEVVFLAL